MKIKTTFFQDFKAFITKGNVIDMAVGVVIGGSFGKIVTGLVNYIINPFVGIFLKTGSLDSIKTVITPEELEKLVQDRYKKYDIIQWVMKNGSVAAALFHRKRKNGKLYKDRTKIHSAHIFGLSFHKTSGG